MSSDPWVNPHHHHHDQTSSLTGQVSGLFVHAASPGADITAMPGGADAITNLTDLPGSVSNLSAADTGHYQSLIEGHSKSITLTNGTDPTNPWMRPHHHHHDSST